MTHYTKFLLNGDLILEIDGLIELKEGKLFTIKNGSAKGDYFVIDQNSSVDVYSEVLVKEYDLKQG
jgi:hypothetical protein